MKKSLVYRIFAPICLAVSLVLCLSLWGCSREGKGITLDIHEATVYLGESITLTVGSENGYPITDYTFRVEGDSVSVDGGLTVTGISEGEANIVFTASDGSSAECKVRVVLPPQSIELVLPDTDGFAGDLMEISLNVLPETAVYTYTLTSSDESVVSVDGDTLRLLGEGTATVTVTTHNGLTFSKRIKVYPAMTFSIDGVDFSLYDPLSVITDVWGEPESRVRLALEPEGYIYNREAGYTVIFTDGEEIKGFYTDVSSFTSGDLIFGQTIGQVSRILSADFTEGRHSVLTFRNGVWTEVFFDRLGSGGSFSVFVGGQGCSELKEQTAQTLEGYAEVLFGITNSYRRSLRLPLLEYYEALEGATLSHCADMIENGFVGHESSDGSRIGDRITALDIDWRACAENIAAGYTLPFAAFSGLVNSKGHRDNIISEKYALTGISALYGEDSRYGTYVTQIFCTIY